MKYLINTVEHVFFVVAAMVVLATCFAVLFGTFIGGIYLLSLCWGAVLAVARGEAGALDIVLCAVSIAAIPVSFWVFLTGQDLDLEARTRKLHK